MPKVFLFIILIYSIGISAQDTAAIHPHAMTYRCRILMANSSYVHTKDVDSLVVVLDSGRIFSMSSLRPDLSHLTDTRKRIRYSILGSKKTFKLEKVNPDTTSYIYTYVKLDDTLMVGNFVGYRRRFTMKDKFTGVTYTVVLYECPQIKIDPEYSKYLFGEFFFMKVPIRLEGGIIKALAEERINDKPVSRDELLISTFDNASAWPGVSFESPIDKGYTLMLPDGTPKEKKYIKELLEDLSGRKDYPTIQYREEFDHY